MKTILQCGYGTIGKRMYPDYTKLGDVTVFDPYVKVSELNFYTDFNLLKSKHFDFAILCLPTPTVDGKCDCSIVKEMAIKIKDMVDIIIVRSTVYVGFMRELLKEVPNAVFFPEFYGVTQHQAVNDFAILCGNRKLTKKVAQLFYAVKPASFKVKYYEDPTVGEMIKYMCNCYLATKVVFCNSIAAACDKMGIEYDDVREGWLLDSRVNPSHSIVYDDHHYYDSHCFNKDVPAFANQFNDAFLKAVDDINNSRRNK